LEFLLKKFFKKLKYLKNSKETLKLLKNIKFSSSDFNLLDQYIKEDIKSIIKDLEKKNIFKRIGINISKNRRNGYKFITSRSIYKCQSYFK